MKVPTRRVATTRSCVENLAIYSPCSKPCCVPPTTVPRGGPSSSLIRGIAILCTVANSKNTHIKPNTSVHLLLALARATTSPCQLARPHKARAPLRNRNSVPLLCFGCTKSHLPKDQTKVSIKDVLAGAKMPLSNFITDSRTSQYRHPCRRKHSFVHSPTCFEAA